MSENDDIGNEESMIKYLRDKIIGHPAVFSRAGDLPIDDNITSIKRTTSQDSLSDGTSMNQVDKVLAAGSNSGIQFARRPLSSSSPIIIPKKPPRSDASSQSSSSYTSVVDQMSSVGDSSVPSDDPNPTLPTLPSACQQLEHSAARDRISVKNKRRQPTKQRLSTLRETDDNENDLFSSKIEAISSTPEEDQLSSVTTRMELKIQQPLIDLTDLDSARARLRMSVRSRDRSADNILLAINSNITPAIASNRSVIDATIPSPIQRSSSFKRPQEMTETKLIIRPILKSKQEVTMENDLLVSKSNGCSFQNENLDEQRTSPIRSRSSSQEHIYDNLDVFKRAKPNVNISTNEDESSSVTVLKTREPVISTPRLRPLTMHISTNNDIQTSNEFENAFHQFKKRGSIRRVRPDEETTTTIEPTPIEQPPVPSPPQIEPIISNNKPIEKTLSSPPPQTTNRRKTVGGVHLPANNKVATNDNKPAPSWIDIAKQKQNKFQSVSHDKNHENESEQQPSIESSITIRKQVPSIDIRSNRKSMFEQSTTQTNTNAIERDSIRALKAGNPNRINNLIQFFDK